LDVGEERGYNGRVIVSAADGTPLHVLIRRTTLESDSEPVIRSWPLGKLLAGIRPQDVAFAVLCLPSLRMNYVDVMDVAQIAALLEAARVGTGEVVKPPPATMPPPNVPRRTPSRLDYVRDSVTIVLRDGRRTGPYYFNARNPDGSYAPEFYETVRRLAAAASPRGRSATRAGR